MFGRHMQVAYIREGHSIGGEQDTLAVRPRPPTSAASVVRGALRCSCVRGAAAALGEKAARTRRKTSGLHQPCGSSGMGRSREEGHSSLLALRPDCWRRAPDARTRGSWRARAARSHTQLHAASTPQKPLLHKPARAKHDAIVISFTQARLQTSSTTHHGKPTNGRRIPRFVPRRRLSAPPLIIVTTPQISVCLL